MSRLLAVCGGKHQVPLIRRAKELGHTIFNSNLYPDSPGFEFADGNAVLDVLDMEGNCSYAEKCGVEGIITDQSEISVRTVAYVSERLGLPSISYETSMLFTNKELMRLFLNRAGFACPLYKACSTIDDALDFMQRHQKKGILKPTYSDSSKGVFTVYTENDVLAHYDEAFEMSREINNKVIIEEYIDGDEFTVDAVVVNHEVINLAVSKKSHYSFNENIANSLEFSYTDSDYDYDELRLLNTAILNESGIPFGLTHSEYKYCNGQFHLIEMAARGGGARISSLIAPYLSGVDNYAVYIAGALGCSDVVDVAAELEKVSLHKNRKAVLRFVDFRQYGKKVLRINGISQIKTHKNIAHLDLLVKEGDCLSPAKDDSTRHGYYIAFGESDDELAETERYVQDNLTVETEDCGEY